jgi:hypothetical protein
MSTKLTDTQLLMLGAAAQRKDRCVAAPPNLKGAAAQKFAADLVDAGLAKEVKARPGAHIWRCDDVTRQAYALKLTPAGLKTIRVEETEVLGTAIETSPTPAGEGPRKTKVHDSRAGSVAPPGTIAAPREGSKLAKTRGRRYNRSTSRRDGLACCGNFHRISYGSPPQRLTAREQRIEDLRKLIDHGPARLNPRPGRVLDRRLWLTFALRRAKIVKRWEVLRDLRAGKLPR